MVWVIPFCSPVAELNRWLRTQKFSGVDRSAQTRQVHIKSLRIHLHPPPNPTCSRWNDHEWLKADYKAASPTHYRLTPEDLVDFSFKIKFRWTIPARHKSRDGSQQLTDSLQSHRQRNRAIWSRWWQQGVALRFPHSAIFMERILHRQLKEYLFEHGSITGSITGDQSAWSLHRDCATQANATYFRYTQWWAVSGMYFFDLAKCFYTIDHDILLIKVRTIWNKR